MKAKPKFDKHMRPISRHVSRETVQRLEEERESRSAKKRIETARKKLIGEGFVMDKFTSYLKRFQK